NRRSFIAGCLHAQFRYPTEIDSPGACSMRLALTLAVVLLLTHGSRAADTDGWVELFSGKDLTGWVIDGPTEYKDKADGNKPKPLWTVQDGVIRTTGGAFGSLRYDKEYSDFILHVEYRLVKEKGANSGIGIRTRKYDPKDGTASRPSFYSYEV